LLIRNIKSAVEQVDGAYDRAVELAQQSSRAKDHCGPLIGYCGWKLYRGDYTAALQAAERLANLGKAGADPIAVFVADRSLAQASHYLGDQNRARNLAERVLHHPPIAVPFSYDLIPIDPALSMQVILARIRWLQGFPGEAAEFASTAMRRAAVPFTLCQALSLAACPVALWCGHDGSARRFVDLLLDRAVRYSLPYWESWGRCFAAVLAYRASGSPPSISTVSPFQSDSLATFAIDLVTPEAIARAESGAAGWCAPEILRAQAEILTRAGTAEADAQAEPILLRSLDAARQQSASAWELRTATSLARLWQRRERAGEAHALLSEHCGRFGDKAMGDDIAAARALLVRLR
jgi:hypothetical protein